MCTSVSSSRSLHTPVVSPRTQEYVLRTPDLWKYTTAFSIMRSLQVLGENRRCYVCDWNAKLKSKQYFCSVMFCSAKRNVYSIELDVMPLDVITLYKIYSILIDAENACVLRYNDGFHRLSCPGWLLRNDDCFSRTRENLNFRPQ